jgi:guanylate kinase
MKMIDDDQLIEYAEYVENFYGTPKEYVDAQLESGKDVILEIEIQGALKVKEKFPDTLLLFVTPSSMQVLKQRLVGRGTEDCKTIDCRLKRAALEAEGIDQYDYLIINDNLEECIERTHNIIEGEHCRASRNVENIEQIREELKIF